MKTVAKLKVKLVFLQIFSFLFSITPLAVAVFINRAKYFSTPEESVKLGIGAVIAAVFILMKVLAKIKIPRRIVTYGIVFAMAYFLESILADLLLLSGMAFLGEFVDLIFFQKSINRTREAISNEKIADVTAVQVENVLNKFVGSGRT